jgi:WD40 repeat protein
MNRNRAAATASGPMYAVALRGDGKKILTGSSGKTPRHWETATGKPLGPPLQHQDMVMALAFSPDGKTVLTESYDKTARLWEAATGKPLSPPFAASSRGCCRGLQPKRQDRADAGSADKTARLWETATGKPLGPPLQHQDLVRAVAFSPAGKTVLTESYDKTARLWRVPRPIEGDPERIVLWAQVITGLELDDYGGTRFLDAATWEQRRQRLQELGGPPEQ